jgi:hypothetical protein
VNYVPPILPVVTWAWMRSAGTSTWETPRKENRSSTRYFGGCSEVCLRMWPTASVTAAWKVTPPASSPARFTRTSWPGWKIASIGKCSRLARVNARAQHRAPPRLCCPERRTADFNLKRVEQFRFVRAPFREETRITITSLPCPNWNKF